MGDHDLFKRLDYSKVAPEIRNTVKWLRKNHYKTVRSSNQAPWVIVCTTRHSDQAGLRAGKLFQKLMEHGVPFGPSKGEEEFHMVHAMGGSYPSVFGIEFPMWDRGCIVLRNIDDQKMGLNVVELSLREDDHAD